MELENIIKCGEFLDVLNDDQRARKVSAVQSALRGLNNHSSTPQSKQKKRSIKIENNITRKVLE